MAPSLGGQLRGQVQGGWTWSPGVTGYSFMDLGVQNTLLT